MQTVSERFAAAMDSRPYIARITLDGQDVIQGDAVGDICFYGGAGDREETVSLGSAVAGSVEVTLQKELTQTEIAGRSMFIELGIDFDGDIEWLPMGTYTAGNVTDDDGAITVPGMDAMASKLDVEYEALEGFDFSADGGVDSLAFLQALCQRRGIAVDTTGLASTALTVSPNGYTERKIVGMLAAINGKFAYIDRTGVLCFRWYTAVDVTITDDHYYAGGMERAEYAFQAAWIKCFVDGMEETLCEGDAEGEQGIYFECIWMTEERLAAIWEVLQGFAYRPVKTLSFQGDPRLDPGDIITLQDGNANSFSVPVMSISHEYDGGLITEMSADGKLKTEYYEGPVAREMKRTTASILKKTAEIEMSVKTTYDQTAALETELSVMEEEISMKFSSEREQIAEVDGELQSFLNKFSKYIKFTSETAITIGSGDSAITLEIDNETGIVFKKNGVQFGWWDGVDFHTGNIVVEVNERAQFGNFAFVPRSDGSLSFLKVGD